MTNTSSAFPHIGREDVVQYYPHWPTAAVILIVVAALIHTLLKEDHFAKLPAVGKGRLASRRQYFLNGGAASLYNEGYKKFKDGVFRIATSRSTDSIIVSPKFLNELKALPDSILSFGASLAETMHINFTRMEFEFQRVPHTVRASLTPALPRLNSTLAEEVAEVMRLELPQSSTWTEINVNCKLLRIVAMASGRVFVGHELCRDEAYLDAAINYTVDTMSAVHAISRLPAWMRPFRAHWIPEVKKLKGRIVQADRFLRPVVKARRVASEKQDLDYQKPDDMLQWLMDSHEKFGETSDRDLAANQLGISFAAIHTTAMVTTNALYWLAAKPELTPMLREDVVHALAESGGSFSSVALQSMKKLDSFLKEVLRASPMSTGSFERKALKTFTLSNGQTVPAGALIEVPHAAITSDNDIFPNAETFDAMRFYNLRLAKQSNGPGAKDSGTAANNQFVSVGMSSLTFGYGRHACPGRFFAVNEIKMIMANIVMKYEIKLPAGVVGRYPNVPIGSSIIPDPTKSIMIRKT